MPRPADAPPLAELLRRIDAAADEGGTVVDGVATGYPSADKLLGGGLRRGDLVVLGGDVSSGKSALALAIAYRAAESLAPTEPDGTPSGVCFVSGEMTPERVAERLLALEGRARVDDLRRGALDEGGRAAVGAAALRLRDARLAIEPLPARGADGMADLLRRTLDLRLAVVDSLELLAAGGRGRDEEVAYAVRALKAVALELDVPILVTAQLTNLDRARRDLRPRLEDFAGLGAVREHADVILGIFREEMYASAQGVEGATELIALKNRNGPTGYVDLYFYAQWLRFEDMLDPDR